MPTKIRQTERKPLSPGEIPDWLFGIGYPPGADDDNPAPVPRDDDVVAWLMDHGGEHLTITRGTLAGPRGPLRHPSIGVKAEWLRRRLEALGARNIRQTGPRFFDYDGEIMDQMLTGFGRRIFRDRKPEYIVPDDINSQGKLELPHSPVPVRAEDDPRKLLRSTRRE